ncbi:tRNA lysidine(34) synthetase TilS [Cohnella ginsengisoli]|uniref:tRNA(Ile)-lysidine synthase n=1 Tax=Cohnella ginsengisoli TaxID=425004 RepID=A0A9X4KNJ4_9BACL|nr:tRNA lysidine(34) synthetase TilS [Cohnella ginsengisoli]MDG0795323.1 tRNA lysidine(34) synthetase TilS [Cohnella ginsengisoli]
MEAQDDLAVRIARLLRDTFGIGPGARIVAGVSGGPDSMAMLHLLQAPAVRDGWLVIAAHVNHGFRGTESDAEAALVRETAAAWGIPFELAEIDMPAYIEATGLNSQAASRERRYAFLRDVARRHGAKTIAVAHHADDQAETVLMRMLRGSGVTGLAGIPMRRAEEELELIRPLLRITKGELLAYNERHGVPFATDSSNAKTHYVRNAIRLEALPYLERYNPDLRAGLARLAELASADDDYMEAEARRALAAGARRSGGGWRLDARLVRGFHLALQRRMIKLILNGLAGPHAQARFEQVEEIVAILTAARPDVARVDIGGGLVLLREYGYAYIGPAPDAQAGYAYTVAELPARTERLEVSVPECGLVFRFSREAGICDPSPGSRWEAFFDEAELALPLAVRSRMPGDRMEPLGLNGSKKVQDILVDAKVPRSLRHLKPLLIDGDGRILWIPGLRRSRHAVPKPNSGAGAAIRVTCSESSHHTV